MPPVFIPFSAVEERLPAGLGALDRLRAYAQWEACRQVVESAPEQFGGFEWEDPYQGDVDRDGDRVTVAISGPISSLWGVSLPKVMKLIRAEHRDSPLEAIHLDISSPGGDAAEGIAAYSALRQQYAGKGVAVSARTVGMAASAAAQLYLAGDRREIDEVGMLMYHLPWSILVSLGTRARHRSVWHKEDRALAAFERQAISAVTARTDLNQKDAMAMLREESWYVGEEAVDAGLATHFVEADEPPADPPDPGDGGADEGKGADAKQIADAVLSAYTQEVA